VIAAVVGGLSALTVVGLNSTLTGGEGNLGPGLLMLFIAILATPVVGVLAVLAVVDGVRAPRTVGTAGRSKSARIGIALGVVEITAVIAATFAGIIWSVS
jgi:hypothetical protein